VLQIIHASGCAGGLSCSCTPTAVLRRADGSEFEV
jgi:hypothetical protein